MVEHLLSDSRQVICTRVPVTLHWLAVCRESRDQHQPILSLLLKDYRTPFWPIFIFLCTSTVFASLT